MLGIFASKMVQQLDQQEVPEVPSAPAGNLYAAQLRPSIRSRKLSRKARENADEDALVPPLSKRRRTRATAPQTPKSTSNPTANSSNLSSQTALLDALSPQPTTQLLSPQNPSTDPADPADPSNPLSNPPDPSNPPLNPPSRPSWVAEFNAASSKPKKLDILVKNLAKNPFPQRLQIPDPIIQPRAFPHLSRPINSDPRHLFDHFLPPRLYADFAKYTNTYATQQNAPTTSLNCGRPNQPRQRYWKTVFPEDIEVYFGALILIGAQSNSGELESFWDTSPNTPEWPISKYISRDRFEQITKYLKVCEPVKLADKDWFKVVEPLATAFRAAITPELIQLPTHFSIDEILVKSKGRSKHLLKIGSKAAGQGYKIYTAALSGSASGFLLDFRFTSATESIAELKGDWSKWPPTAKLILELATSIKRRFRSDHSYVVHLDRFFSRLALFQRLFEEGIGANGTCATGAGHPQDLLHLNKLWTKQSNFTDWFNEVIGNVNCIAVCDSTTVFFMTTVFDPIKQSGHWYDSKKRKNVKRDPLRLPIPSNDSEETVWIHPLYRLLPLHEYNQHMNGSDVHAQLESYYSTAKHRHLRNWWPLLHFFLNAAITNSFILHKMIAIDNREKPLTHVGFQSAVGLSLLSNPVAATRQRARRQDKQRDPFCTADNVKKPPIGHEWGWQKNQRRCVSCKMSEWPRGRPKKRATLAEISTNLPSGTPGPSSHRVRKYTRRTRFVCTVCEVSVCNSTECRDLHLRRPQDR